MRIQRMPTSLLTILRMRTMWDVVLQPKTLRCSSHLISMTRTACFNTNRKWRYCRLTNLLWFIKIIISTQKINLNIRRKRVLWAIQWLNMTSKALLRVSNIKSRTKAALLKREATNSSTLLQRSSWGRSTKWIFRTPKLAIINKIISNRIGMAHWGHPNK